MAEFLTTADVNARLEKIIENAKKELVLISPYLKVHDRLKQSIEVSSRSGVKVQIVYREEKQKQEVSAWLESLTHVGIGFCKGLHAKCYLNEREALLTSMNLYEFSQQNNYEMGILVSSRSETTLYGKIYDEAYKVLQASTTVREPAPQSSTAPSPMKAVGSMLQRFGRALEQDRETTQTVEALENSQSDHLQSSHEAPIEGFCIRCRVVIPANPDMPYCKSHYRTWNRYKNETYKEDYCHMCGNEYTATMLKPVCHDCYTKYKDDFFVAS